MWNLWTHVLSSFMFIWLLGQSETLQACLCPVVILCSPPQCLCSSSSRCFSFSSPSAPGSVLHFYFVCRWTEINKSKLNITFAVCCRIYLYLVLVGTLLDFLIVYSYWQKCICLILTWRDNDRVKKGGITHQCSATTS